MQSKLIKTCLTWIFLLVWFPATNHCVFEFFTPIASEHHSSPLHHQSGEKPHPHGAQCEIGALGKISINEFNGAQSEDQFLPFVGFALASYDSTKEITSVLRANEHRFIKVDHLALLTSAPPMAPPFSRI